MKREMAEMKREMAEMKREMAGAAVKAAEAVRRARKLARKQAIREGLLPAPPKKGLFDQLLDNLPNGEVHDRWRFAIQLCAVYGLRPEELRHLRQHRLP